MIEGFSKIFNDAEKCYNNKKKLDLNEFRNRRDLYGFLINTGGKDTQALNFAKDININLYNEFCNKKKSLVGYKNIENIYCKIDDLDSKHIFILTFLFNEIGNEHNKIIEIGGGFGNILRLMEETIKFNEYNIIDIPHIIELQKFYLKNELSNNTLKKINFYDCHTSNIIINEEIDLVLGLHSLSELSWDFFKKYFDDIITKSKYLFLSLNKNCPSPFLIKKKLDYIVNNNFKIQKKFEYTEYPHGAHVLHVLFKRI